MSKQKPTKKRKTRLKGTDTQKPCLVCKKTKDRFKDFKPRWAGCELHRTERGRRYFQPGCEACAAKVNGNIRQPRCIECDSKRPKKGAAKKAATPTPTPVKAQAATEAILAPCGTLGTFGEGIRIDPAEIAQNEADNAQAPEPVVVVAPEPEPEPEPVVVVTPEPEVVALDEPSPESVTLPEPEARPQIASMSDLSKLFGGDDSDGE